MIDYFILSEEVRNEASTSTAMQYEQVQKKLKELCEKYEDEVRELRSRLNQDGYVLKMKRDYAPIIVVSISC